MLAFYNRTCENIMNKNISVLKLQKWCLIKVN